MSVGGAILGALRVVLGADTAAFEQGFGGASKKLDAFAKTVESAGQRIGFALSAAAVGLTLAIRKTLQDAEKLGETAQKIGIPVEALSRLKHAAEMQGVAFESLTTAMGRFSRNMADAAADATGNAARAFDAIGVSATTAAGNLRPTTEVLGDIAERFSRMTDGAGKTALAIQIFGRQGAELIPLLNAGRDGLNALMREADALGITLDARTAAAAERFNDNLDRIHKVASGLFLRISTNLLPVLELLAEKFLGVAKNSEFVKQMADSVNAVFGFMVQQVAHLTVFVQRLGAELSALMEMFKLFAKGEFAAGWKVMTDAAAETERARAALRGFNQEIANATGAWRAYVEVAPTVPTVQAPIVQSANSAADALRRMRDEARAALDTIINSPTETFEAKMAAVTAALQKGTISFTQFGNITRQIQKENVGHMHDLASATSSALTTIFGKSKVAAIAAAVINTAQGITRNLAQYPQPIAGIMAAITAASGAAQIAAIRSANMGGGGGSTPSASAGGGGAAAGAAAPMGGVLTVEGLSPDRILSGASARTLAEMLMQYNKDGGVVRFA